VGDAKVEVVAEVVDGGLALLCKLQSHTRLWGARVVGAAATEE
jgi:hypothetical protein